MATAQGINGVNVETLVATVGAVKENPELGKFKFRCTTEWIEGGHSRTTIQSFFGVGAEDTSRPEAFVLEGDEPPVLLGTNKAPNAVEAVLSALASCLSVGFAYNAAAKGITIESLQFDLEGDLDLRGFLGISEQVRAGYEGIHVTTRIKSNASTDQLKELAAYVERTSPVLDIISNPVPVTISLES